MLRWLFLDDGQGDGAENMAADEFIYVITIASECFRFNLIRSSGAAISAMGQPAVLSGKMIFFCGESIAADSAIKCTPQNTTMSALFFAAIFASSSESPQKSAISCISSF